MREEFVLPPPVPADSPFQLRLAGVSYCDGSYRIERETADFSVVEYVERGTGTLEIDGEEFHPSAGDLYFLPEGSRHRYWSDAHNPWVKYWMNFGGVLGTGSKLLPFNAGVQCGGYLADALGNFTANAVARNQNCFHK